MKAPDRDTAGDPPTGLPEHSVPVRRGARSLVYAGQGHRADNFPARRETHSGKAAEKAISRTLVLPTGPTLILEPHVNSANHYVSGMGLRNCISSARRVCDRLVGLALLVQYSACRVDCPSRSGQLLLKSHSPFLLSASERCPCLQRQAFEDKDLLEVVQCLAVVLGYPRNTAAEELL